MTTGLVIAAILAIAIVATGLYVIFRCGPGTVRRRLRCPEKNVAARVEVLRKEGTWGTLLESDVTSCSLFPEGSIDCAKACLARK